MSTQASNTHSSYPRRAIIKTLASGALASAFASAGWTVQATARPMLEIGQAVELPKPVKLVFIFGRPTDVLLFEGNYVTNHLPKALKLPGCLALEEAQAVSDADGADPAFYRITMVSFASHQDMADCISSDAGREVIADIANFATGGVTATVVTNIKARQP